MQNETPPKPKFYRLLLPLLLVLAGIILILAQFFGEFTLLVNGGKREARALAFTSGQLLQAAGYSLQPEDEIFPAPARLNLTHRTIVLNQARPVTVRVGDESTKILSAETLPANLLAQAGLTWFPEDWLFWEGRRLNPTEPLPPGADLQLEFVPAKRVDLQFETQTRVFFTQQPTLGAALDEAGIRLRPEDALSQPTDTVLTAQNTVSVRLAREMSIQVGGQQYSGLSAAESVGEALRDLGLPLQNLDYSQPDENQPVPADGQMRIVRVSEEILLQTEETAYNNSYADDPDAELDTISVLVPGQIGLVVTRERLRLEDGVETGSRSDGPWKASDPEDGVLGRGTKVVVRTETINGETIEYWRKVSVYATSYKPSSQGGGTGTASGIPLTKGIIAVTRAWYLGMKLQPVYVPGYGRGIIADTGGGIPGRYWIDLGFDDSNYESWHFWTTLYFLTPIPGYIPVVLP
ncbi:MAG: ubiquitin-like domain-containing protein [Anaerolineaceae bacterium]